MKTCVVVHASEIDSVHKLNDLVYQLELRLGRRGGGKPMFAPPIRPIRPGWRTSVNTFLVELNCDPEKVDPSEIARGTGRIFSIEVP